MASWFFLAVLLGLVCGDCNSEIPFGTGFLSVPSVCQRRHEASPLGNFDFEVDGAPYDQQQIIATGWTGDTTVNPTMIVRQNHRSWGGLDSGDGQAFAILKRDGGRPRAWLEKTLKVQTNPHACVCEYLAW